MSAKKSGMCGRPPRDTRVVKPGSVSLSRAGDRRTRWALLTAGDAGHRIDLRSTAYDVDSVLADPERKRHPAAGWVAAKLMARHGLT
jgi:hypothetical protein